jgi:hypothetical protein
MLLVAEKYFLGIMLSFRRVRLCTSQSDCARATAQGHALSFRPKGEIFLLAFRTQVKVYNF